MRVCLLHDIFRAEIFGQGGQNHTSRMWEQVLGPVLAGLGHQLIRPPAFTVDHPPELAAFAAAHGFGRDIATWLALYASPATLPLVERVMREQVLAPIGGADLVLGWEMSPNMMRALVALGQRVIEFNLDQVRFCPDLFLRARSNDPALVAWLDRHAVPDAVPRAHAERLAASLPAAPGHRPAMLFAGQVGDDSSLIANGAFARVEDRHLAPGEGEALLLKPHPYGAPHPDIRALHAAWPQAMIVPDNIYALLAAPWVRRVVTLTSSVATEAAFFGKPARRLVTPDQAPERLPEFGAYRRLDQRFLTAACWADLLGGAADGATPPAIGRLFSRSWGRFAAPPAVPSRRLPRGVARGFGAGGEGLVHRGFGWAEPGEGGSAAEGDFATLLLTPEAPAVRLEARACAPFTLALATRPDGREHRLQLPAEARIDLTLPTDRLLELTLRPSVRFVLKSISAPS